MAARARSLLSMSIIISAERKERGGGRRGEGRRVEEGEEGEEGEERRGEEGKERRGEEGEERREEERKRTRIKGIALKLPT